MLKILAIYTEYKIFLCWLQYDSGTVNLANKMMSHSPAR